ncbi:hypothetical protein Daura_24465 [Dactylosporangium aurantiacum]|uniref:Uncharacterized protein n=1 Tax=Dactylosporangium aurantiacum TaxID=35754 RepID=A0A9Q9MLJ1_9ACTN|nr:DUF6766 family protein [Dactylosporangium aurantiacum]MDG6103751.1 hypothetical protein [Dactylosporangium aurantiacum]UWZ59035.1 hypothetical protein Daura_24465 [Dactylosporangium aurantiacum]
MSAPKRSGDDGRVRRFARENSLGLVFGVLFVLALVGQAFAGHADFNQQQVTDGLPPISFGRYLTSADFAVDVAENWQSEYLQFFLFIVLTVWLLQRGSPESKSLDEAGIESDKDQMVGPYAPDDAPAWAKVAGWRRWLLSNSLGLVMGGIFVLSWLAQSVAGVAAFNERQLSQLQDPVSWSTYLTEPDFWNRTLQNWQSELLAVFSMAVLAIYLRQRGSPESKPVGAAHTSTGVEG